MRRIMNGSLVPVVVGRRHAQRRLCGRERLRVSESSMLRRRQIARVLAPNKLPVRFQGSMAAVAIPPSLAPGPDGAANARRHQIGLVRSNVAVRMATLRSDEHTHELKSLMRISYALF